MHLEGMIWINIPESWKLMVYAAFGRYVASTRAYMRFENARHTDESEEGSVGTPAITAVDLRLPPLTPVTVHVCLKRDMLQMKTKQPLPGNR